MTSEASPSGIPVRCQSCGHSVPRELPFPPEDLYCATCGQLLWQPLDWLARELGFVPAGAVLPSLEARSVPAAIEALVERLVQIEAIAARHRSDVIREIMVRERFGSTGIGRGLAIPHARHASVNHTIGAIGQSRQGISAAALDEAPVHLFVLLVSPTTRPGEHLRALESTARVLRRFH